MNEKSKLKILLFVLVIIFFGVNYPTLDKALTNWFIDYEIGIVERVIDGDTLVVNGTTIRLLGINCPEKGEKYYNEAKSYLENRALYNIVKLKSGKEDVDRYKRKLRYVLSQSDENFNLELVREGYANYYFPSGKDVNYVEFREAWEECLEEEINLCEKSTHPCSNCINLVELNVATQRLNLRNDCSFYCDITNWSIKDEGRKKFIFEGYVLEDTVEIIVGHENSTQDQLYWEGETYVWTESGDTLFLRDAEGKLVLWKGY